MVRKNTWFETVYEPTGSLEINVFKGRSAYIYIYTYMDYTHQEMFVRLPNFYTIVKVTE